MTVGAGLLPNGRQQYLDGNGKPLAGGQVFFYIPNTTTPKNTWQDADQTSLNTNPVLLDANGEAVIFGDGEYRQVLKDVFGTTVWDQTTLFFVSFSGGDLQGDMPNPTLKPTVIASTIAAAPTKATPANADEFVLLDSANSFTLANMTWLSMLTAILAYVTTQGAFAAPSAPGAAFANLAVTVNSNTNVTVSASAVSVQNGSGDFINLNSVNATANIASSGAGGLDTGTEAASTWYYVFVIYDPTTQNVAALISVSASAPVMPSGYTYSRRVGAIRNDAASNLWRTSQKGAKAQVVVGSNPTTINVASSGANGSTSVPTWVAVALGSFVPPTAGVVAGTVYIYDAGTNRAAMVAPDNSYGAISSSTNFPPVAVTGQTIGAAFELVLESTSIYWASQANCALAVTGWVDEI